MSNILEYRKINPSLSYAVLSSTYRYLTPQLITLALTDNGLEDSSREEIARVLHSQKRKVIKTGKSYFPILLYGATATRENMSCPG